MQTFGQNLAASFATLSVSTDASKPATTAPLSERVKAAKRAKAARLAKHAIRQPGEQSTSTRADITKAAARAAKPAAPAIAAKPTAADREAARVQAADERSLAKQAAARAVAEFYSGASKPFKAATDRCADINFANGKAAKPRQAALMLALITYGAGNMRSDGTFIRGAFTVPARLINPNAPASATVRAQPESGCLGNILGRAADYVSGPTTGREQSAAIYRLRIPIALSEIQAAFGDKARANAEKLIQSFAA